MTTIVLSEYSENSLTVALPTKPYLSDLIADQQLSQGVMTAIEAGKRLAAEKKRKPTLQETHKIAPLLNRAHALVEKNKYSEAKKLYEKILKHASHYQSALSGLGGCQFKLDRPFEAITTLIFALEIDNSDETTWNSLALSFKEVGDVVLAERAFKQAIRLESTYVKAKVNLAETLSAQDRFDEALAILEELSATDSHDPLVLRVLANTYSHANKDDQAILYFTKLPHSAQLECAINYTSSLNRTGELRRAIGVADLALDGPKKNNVDLLINKSSALLGLGKRGEAFELLSEALELRQDCPIIFWNLGLILLRVGEFETGLDLYEYRFKANRLPLPDAKRRWNGVASLKGKTFYVMKEQGLGDVIQYCRYIPMLEALGAKVVFKVPEATLPLVRTLASQASIIAETEPEPSFDYFCPLMSLPKAFNTRLETIPASASYLFADRRKSAACAKRIGDVKKLKIGISWSGNPQHLNDVSRSIKLTEFSRLFKEIDAQFYVLQTTFSEKDTAQLSVFDNVQDFSGDLHDFTDTAALVDNMDLVISVDTSVVHVAGALGKPVWALISTSHDFRWIAEQNTSPWYPSMRLFRQQEYGQWQSVFEEVITQARQFDKDCQAAPNTATRRISPDHNSVIKQTTANPKPTIPPPLAGWLANQPEGYNVKPVGDGYAYVHERALIDGDVSLGRFTYVNGQSTLGGNFPISIGAFCSIASGVYCWTSESHQTQFVSSYPLRTILGMDIGYSEIAQKPEGVTIGNDVWIGHEARIMAGARIGHGVVVAARAVVTKNLEPYGIYGGVPAKLIRKRFAQPVIDALLDIQWWNWDIDTIRANTEFFNLNLDQITDAQVLYDVIVPVQSSITKIQNEPAETGLMWPAVEEPISCKVCRSDTRYVGSVDANKSCEDHRGQVFPEAGEDVPYYQCVQCKLLFTPFMDKWTKQEFSQRIYNDDYIKVDPDYKMARPQALSNTVKDFAAQVGAKRILDYGAGEGLMAKILRKQGLACDAWDPFGGAGQHKPKRKSYDLITAFEVFEHTAAPVKTVSDLLAYAGPSTLILFSTLAQDNPDRPDINHWYVGPRNGHDTIYSLESLRELFARFGWQVHHFNNGTHLAYKVRPSFLG